MRTKRIAVVVVAVVVVLEQRALQQNSIPMRRLRQQNGDTARAQPNDQQAGGALSLCSVCVCVCVFYYPHASVAPIISNGVRACVRACLRRSEALLLLRRSQASPCVRCAHSRNVVVVVDVVVVVVALSCAKLEFVRPRMTCVLVCAVGLRAHIDAFAFRTNDPAMYQYEVYSNQMQLWINVKVAINFMLFGYR